MIRSDQQTVKADVLGGGVLILALAIMIIGAAIPFFAPSLKDAPWSDEPEVLAAAIAGNPSAWVWANSLFLAAALITTLGLVPITTGFRGSSRPWALTALVCFSIAAAIEGVDRIISIEVFTWAAQQNIDLSGFTAQAFIRLDEGLGSLFSILGFLTLGLYGIALLQRARACGLGWVFVVGGTLGIILEVFGAAIPGMIYFGTGAFGAVIFMMPATN